MARGGAWIPTATTRLLEICCKACLAGDRAGPGGSRVDRAAQVIRGVKVLATESRNGRRYSPGCLQRAARLYEGVSVRIDHPQKDDEDRRAGDVLGQLRNVRVGPAGLYADLHYLASHPMSKRLCEAAEKMPKAFGLSHNVSDWEGHYEGGTYVVDEILEVESVDLVADPATTNGLFESHKKRRRGRRMKLTEWLKRQPARTRKVVGRLVEAGAVAGSMLMAEGGDPEAAIQAAFRTAITAVLDDGAADVKAKMARIKDILTAEEKLMASGAVTPPTADDVGLADAGEDAPGDDLGEPDGDELTETDGDDLVADEALDDVDEAPLDYEEDDDLTESSHEDGDEDEDDDEMTESLRRENASLRRELDVRRLCESERVTPTPVLVKALAALDTDDDRKALLRESRRSGRRAVAAAADSFADAITVRDEE